MTWLSLQGSRRYQFPVSSLRYNSFVWFTFVSLGHLPSRLAIVSRRNSLRSDPPPPHVRLWLPFFFPSFLPSSSFSISFFLVSFTRSVQFATDGDRSTGRGKNKLNKSATTNHGTFQSSAALLLFSSAQHITYWDQVYAQNTQFISPVVTLRDFATPAKNKVFYLLNSLLSCLP